MGRQMSEEIAIAFVGEGKSVRMTVIAICGSVRPGRKLGISGHYKSKAAKVWKRSQHYSYSLNLYFH